MTITWQVEHASEPSHAPAVTLSKKSSQEKGKISQLWIRLATSKMALTTWQDANRNETLCQQNSEEYNLEENNKIQNLKLLPSRSMSFSWAASNIDIPTGTLIWFSSPSLSIKVTDILHNVASKE